MIWGKIISKVSQGIYDMQSESGQRMFCFATESLIELQEHQVVSVESRQCNGGHNIIAAVVG
jgi:hypothetical protein